MSAENDSPQEGSATANIDRESRRRSIWHIPVLTPKSQSPDTAARVQPHPEKEFADQATPDLKDIVAKGLSLSTSPEEAQSWLVSFGGLKPGTNVSLRFTDLRDGTTSLLSLLIQWVPLWYSKADKSRRDKSTTSKSALARDQKNLDWLLQYVRDYLDLGHTGCDALELYQTVDCITTLCLSTSRKSELNGGINILYTISSHFDFPKNGLEQTSVVLCASFANLPEPPDHLLDCTRALATGDLNEDFMNTLNAFIRTPTLENNSKNLSHARGAARLLCNLLPERFKEGGFVVNLEDFIEQLRFAANQGVFRFCHELLSSVHAILCSDRFKSEISSTNFRSIIEIISICLETTPTSGTNPVKTTLSPITSPDEDRDRYHERHLRDREAMTRKLAQDFHPIWEQLPVTNRDAVNELFLRYPQFADSSQLTTALDYAQVKYLASDDHDTRRNYSQELYEKIVQNHTLSPACRLKGIEVLVQAGTPSHRNSSISNEQTEEAYAWILDKLLEQIDVEQDGKVFWTLLKSLEYMASTYQGTAKEEASTMRTIGKLNDLILTGPAGVSFNDELAILATKVLATTFCYSIHTNAKVAIRTFEVLRDVASTRCKSRPARLVSKRLLFRVRADDAGFIYIASTSQSQLMATALLRTRESTETFNSEFPTSQRHSASSTSLSTKSDVGDPLWMYPETEEVPFPLADHPSSILNVDASARPEVHAELDMDTWLMNIIRCLQADVEWETYSYTIVHVAAQLSNLSLFLNSMEAVVKFRQVLCEQIVNSSFREAPSSTGLKRSDVALCMFNILLSLIPYAAMKSEAVQKGFGDDLVRTFLSGIGGAWEGTARSCIHALTICSVEIPSSVATLYPTIIDKMSKNMTQAYLTAHILEFLVHIALLPDPHSNFNPDEIQMIFGICIQFLEKTREQHHSSITSPPGRINPSTRHSGVNFRRPPYRAAMLLDIGLPQYAAALAYNIMIFWFLSLRLEIRAKYVAWIVARLVWKNARGEETIDEQSQVLIDMMQRTAFSDLGETSPEPNFAGPEDGPVSSASWIVGLSIITAQTAGHTGKTQIIKRQASGTTYARYQQSTTQLPSHHAPSHTEIRHQEATTEMLPSHIILQMVASAAVTSAADQPIFLPEEDFVKRALESFDRIPTVSSHKIGVLYVGEGQAVESEYLANTSGSPDFETFLRGLGYVVSLHAPLHFNPQGLEFPRDGDSTIGWRNRVDEIVYHVPTMMPTDLEDDPQCITKKSHVGNCHVNIIFNRSGLPWSFDNFKSQLNYVNVVIEPACRGRVKPDPDYRPGFYSVHVVTRDDLPNISPAADPKLVSAAQLGSFVRVLSLNASTFCQTWNSKDSDPEFPSSWRARLQQIKRLKERVLSKSSERQTAAAPPSTPSNIGPSAPGGRRTPVPRDEGGGLRRDNVLASQLDFSSWTL